MMSEYQWALGDGSVISADYNRANDSLSADQVMQELAEAFQQFGHRIMCTRIMPEIYGISFEDEVREDIIVCAKGTTPGGRANLNDEQRIQQKSKYINYTLQQQLEGKAAVQLGVYKRDGQTVFCAWKVKQSAAGPETTISKQIKISTIAQAMKEGFAQQNRGGEYACAFRKEFLYFYIRNARWLHDSPVTELSEHSSDFSDEAAVDNESAFKAWLAKLVKADGKNYSENTQAQYMSAMKCIAREFPEELAPYQSVFQIDQTVTFDRMAMTIRSAPHFEMVNRARSNGSLSAALHCYGQFLAEIETQAVPVRFLTGLSCGYDRNRIFFGAPGTGKSYTLNREKDALLADGGEYERVTFHPDYSYANFVGTYKPVPCRDSEGRDVITYSYVPGPFMRIYVKALQNSRSDDPKPFLLVIEEINRANVAAVFGDVFQLLDRDEDETSEYPVQASEDIKNYLAAALDGGHGSPGDYAEIRIPDNLFIWATMNSADQGVLPMDTAFKRRWEFTYLGIDDSEAGMRGKKVALGRGEYCRIVEWNALRKAINEELLTYKVNEDKLMGPYFISKKNLPEGEMFDSAVFTRIFKNKVLMYLFDDAAKQKRNSLFSGCEDKSRNQYSKICREFDTKGVFIFCDAISSQFTDSVPEGDGV